MVAKWNWMGWPDCCDKTCLDRCEGGVASNAYLITLSGFVNSSPVWCTNCPDADGGYVLAYSTPCSYFYGYPVLCSVTPDYPPWCYGNVLIGLSMVFAESFVPATPHRLRISFALSVNDPNCDSAWTFWKDYANPIPCTSLVNEAMPNQIGPTGAPLCSGTPTCTVTSL